MTLLKLAVTNTILKIRIDSRILPKFKKLVQENRTEGVHRIYSHKYRPRRKHKIYGEHVSKVKNGVGYGVRIPKEMRAKFKGVSMGIDKDGYFVYTHRARSKSYPEISKIPKYKIDAIERTG
ncbi:MAG: hypothetical protein SVK08_00480 [Halobacteriota archaeon]|nr:hypothetical protein [Halobacteriota archaeon]